MSSPLKKQPEDVADCVLRRAEVSKIARRLQNRLALAQFKTKHGWEDLTLDIIEPKVEEEIRRRRLYDGDFLSDTSSSASDLPYPTKTLMSSPLKAPLFSDAVGSSNGSSGHRKRTYVGSIDTDCSSPTKRYRTSPTAHRSFDAAEHPSWKPPAHHYPVTQSSPAKHRRQQHFTTSSGPDVSFFPQRRSQSGFVASTNFAAASDDDDELLPAHSFTTSTNMRTSPPRTPPMQTRTLPGKRTKMQGTGGAIGGGGGGAGGGRAVAGSGEAVAAAAMAAAAAAAAAAATTTTTTKAAPGAGAGGIGGAGGGQQQGFGGGGCRPGEEGADLLLYLATSPSPAVKMNRVRTDRPSTPPPKNTKLDLPSSMMTTPGGGTLFPTTPGQGFDFADFVNITPSPAQKNWRTPGGPFSVSRAEPLSVARKRLTFDEPLV